VVIADVALQSAGGAPAGSLTVTAGPVVTGLVLPFTEFFEDCPVSGPSLQYVPVTFAYRVDGPAEDGLAAHLTVTPGPATPADIGDVGVFFKPSPGHDVYCRDYPPLPTTDTFWAHGGPDVVTGYVVLDRAVFPTLQARIDHIRVRDPEGGQRRLTAGPGPVGAACSDDPGALCVPLG
jgi:hypothetical protein